DAEEEGVGERAWPGVLDAPRPLEVGDCEERVDGDVQADEDRDQLQPRGIEQVVVGVALQAPVPLAYPGVARVAADEAAPAHDAGSRMDVNPDGAAGPMTSCSRSPSPSSSPIRARQSCCTCTWRGSIGSSSDSVQVTPSVTSGPFQMPWPHSGSRYPRPRIWKQRIGSSATTTGVWPCGVSVIRAARARRGPGRQAPLWPPPPPDP